MNSLTLLPFVLLHFSLLFLGSRVVPAATSRNPFATAEGEIRAGRYLEAVGLLDDLSHNVSSSETRSGARRRMGDIYALFLSDPPAAGKEYQVAIETAPNSLDASSSRFSLGMIAFESGDCGTAGKYFREFLGRGGAGEKAANARFMLEHCNSGEASPSLQKPPLPVMAPTIRVHVDGTVKVLPIEEYLLGVVPREIPAGWPAEALKAQAVVSRSFALYQILKRKDLEYDVDASMSDQVYGGQSAQKPATNAAVDATRGQVLTHAGGPILAYFHSHSGGAIEKSGEVWSVDLPYFAPRDDPYSTKAKDASWTLRIQILEILHNLSSRGTTLSGLASLRAASNSPSGRWNRVALSDGRGATTMSGNNFRLAVGSDKLKSTLMQVEIQPGEITFRGVGYGHGVGLSQWGAYQLAKEGFDYRAILAYYYRDVEISKLW